MNKIAIIGLGYVGLPLALEFAKKYPTCGFDINKSRVAELVSGKDHTLEADEEDLKNTNIKFTSNLEDIADCNIYIIGVPTPTDKHHKPDLTPLYNSSSTVGSVLSEGDIVIYESTVYPGVTEEECVPVLEKASGLKFNEGFFCGYSPERINQGDKVNTLTKNVKITSGSTPEIATKVDDLYNSILENGTHKAPSIKVAEAAKVIENSQRDINIAFVNELAKIFTALGIDTLDVLEAAGTKWNFLPFRPGLVGGHCIGVDPYYLAQNAQEVGYHPEIILAGRRMNDGMGEWIAGEVIKLMIKKHLAVKDAKVLVLGITFKENCPDIRNTKVVNVIDELTDYGCKVDLYDPWASAVHVKKNYGIDICQEIGNDYSAVVLAVAHDEFKTLNIRDYTRENAVIYDIKGVLNRDEVSDRL
jgi:UDP-N-acetyl-D-galactosamine dehydrogenase